MAFTLDQILILVGKLDDSPAPSSARDRFRTFLKQNVLGIGQIRDYITECLKTPGTQYDRALQDLVNHIAVFLGFDVTFGRYQGSPNEIGFDGLWRSPSDYYIVAEVKTSEVFAIKTATLVGYVDQLISSHEVPSWDKALGLYILGRPDPDIRQLENAIIAENRINQLRIISVESLLSLAEMMEQYDVHHRDVLSIIRPSGPRIDGVVDLMAGLVSEAESELPEGQHSPAATAQVSEPEHRSAPEHILREAGADDGAAYWITSVRDYEEQTAKDCIRVLVGEEQVYAFGDRTPGRNRLKPGDWICFYETGNGVVAHAQVASEPRHDPHPKVRHPQDYPWTFALQHPHLYLDDPIPIDAALRSQLDAFADRPATQPWSWFVQATKTVTKHDFELLTRS